MSRCVPEHVDAENSRYLEMASQGDDALEGLRWMPGVQGEIARMHMANALRAFDLRAESRASAEAGLRAAALKKR